MELGHLALRNASVFERLVPYLVATPFNLPHLHRRPLGLPIPDENVIDPLKLQSRAFLALLERLDGLTFGPEGMPMPRWVFYDCSELPGAIFGFAIPATEATDEVRAVFGLSASYEGLIPFSMYIAIPMFERGSWFGHNLCSIAPTLPSWNLGGLGSVSKALALKVFGVRKFYGATQWDSKALFIHAKFGPLDLMTTYTPAHSEAETLTYSFTVSDEGVRAALGDSQASLNRPEPTEWVTHRDVSRMKEMQAAIEAGERYVIPHAPRFSSDGVLQVPVARVTD
jgi:hypothetical protein